MCAMFDGSSELSVRSFCPRGVSRVRASCTVPLARIRRKLNWVEITALSAVRAGSASRLASIAEGLAGAPLRVCCSLSIGSVGRGALVLP